MDIINKLNKKGNVTMEDILYHGSKMIVSEPEIRKSRFIVGILLYKSKETS